VPSQATTPRLFVSIQTLRVSHAVTHHVGRVMTTLLVVLIRVDTVSGGLLLVWHANTPSAAPPRRQAVKALIRMLHVNDYVACSEDIA